MDLFFPLMTEQLKGYLIFICLPCDVSVKLQVLIYVHPYLGL